MDAGNMLKPALARGELHCVGATTLDEYRQYIEKDGALDRRFQRVLPAGFDLDELGQAREVIEPALAQAAAVSGTEAHFAELEASIARMKALDAQRDQDTFLEENRVFHSIIARAGGNKVLEVFWNTISVLAAGEHHGIRYSVGNQTHVVKAHQRILDACRCRDGAAAAAEMETHVGALENLVRQRYQHLLKHPTSVFERPGRLIA